jgi:hypothetical protein
MGTNISEELADSIFRVEELSKTVKAVRRGVPSTTTLKRYVSSRRKN